MLNKSSHTPTSDFNRGCWPEVKKKKFFDNCKAKERKKIRCHAGEAEDEDSEKENRPDHLTPFGPNHKKYQKMDLSHPNSVRREQALERKVVESKKAAAHVPGRYPLRDHKAKDMVYERKDDKGKATLTIKTIYPWLSRKMVTSAGPNYKTNRFAVMSAQVEEQDDVDDHEYDAEDVENDQSDVEEKDDVGVIATKARPKHSHKSKPKISSWEEDGVGTSKVKIKTKSDTAYSSKVKDPEKREIQKEDSEDEAMEGKAEKILCARNNHPVESQAKEQCAKAEKDMSKNMKTKKRAKRRKKRPEDEKREQEDIIISSARSQLNIFHMAGSEHALSPPTTNGEITDKAKTVVKDLQHDEHQATSQLADPQVEQVDIGGVHRGKDLQDVLHNTSAGALSQVSGSNSNVNLNPSDPVHMGKDSDNDTVPTQVETIKPRMGYQVEDLSERKNDKKYAREQVFEFRLKWKLNSIEIYEKNLMKKGMQALFFELDDRKREQKLRYLCAIYCYHQAWRLDVYFQAWRDYLEGDDLNLDQDVDADVDVNVVVSNMHEEEVVAVAKEDVLRSLKANSNESNQIVLQDVEQDVEDVVEEVENRKKVVGGDESCKSKVNRSDRMEPKREVDTMCEVKIPFDLSITQVELSGGNGTKLQKSKKSKNKFKKIFEKVMSRSKLRIRLVDLDPKSKFKPQQNLETKDKFKIKVKCKKDGFRNKILLRHNEAAKKDFYSQAVAAGREDEKQALVAKDIGLDILLKAKTGGC